MDAKKGSGRPFLEVLSSAIHEDYRFPILEIFAFLYVLGTFVSVRGVIPSSGATSSDAVAYHLTSSLLGSTGLLSLTMFILIIVIFKNIAYGLGSDLEKGIIQTQFSYPLKRGSILTAKLVSALAVSIALFLVVQLSAICLLAPDTVFPNLGIVLLTFAANLSFPLIIACILLLITLFIKRGGPTLVVGVIIYFAFTVGSTILTNASYASKSPLFIQLLSVFSPDLALQQYYPSHVPFWTPAFSEVLLYVGASYAIIGALLSLSYYYFTRRLNL
ncbi:MAG: hypothetical protein NWF05_02445 [Candidatus Bathyarchaeota archaeon]|nr:hypothetical protein [Candidatus Bathyarchaeota archaeon]